MNSRELKSEGMIQSVQYFSELQSFAVQSNDWYYLINDLDIIETLNDRGFYSYPEKINLFDMDFSLKLLTHDDVKYYKFEERKNKFCLYFKFDMQLWRAVFNDYKKMTRLELTEKLL